MVDDRRYWVHSLRAFFVCSLLAASTALAQQATTADAVSIAEVSPASYGAGAELVVKGAGFLPDDVLRIGPTALEVLESQPQRVRVKVPSQLKRGGPLTLVRKRKPAATFAGLTFVPAPVLNAAVPAYARVGQTVTLRGRNLEGVSSIKVGDATVAVATKAAGVLTFVVPEGLQTGAVSVASLGGSASLRKPYEIYYPPIIEAVTPARFAAGMTLEIKGKRFAEGDKVSIGRTPISAATIAPTSIQVSVPGRLLRGGPITIARRGKPAVRFEGVELVPTPKLTAAAPSYASPGGTVTLRGTGLLAIDRLKLGELEVPIATKSDRALTFVVPDKAKTGALTVESLGGEASLKRPYEIFYPPVVSEVSPKRFAAGAKLRVTGTHLAFDSARLCNARLPITVVDDRTLELAVPASARKCNRLQLSQKKRSALTLDGLELVTVPAIVLSSVTPKVGAPGVIEVQGKGLDNVERWSIGELALSADPSRAKEASSTRQWLRVEGQRAVTAPLVAEVLGRTFTSASSVELTVSLAQVTAVRFAPDGKGGATGTVRGTGFTPETVFELDGSALETKHVSASEATFKVSKLPGGGKHRVVAKNGGARGDAYELDGDAAGYRYRAADVLKQLEGKAPKYTLDEIQLDLEQSSVVFRKPAAGGVAALGSVSDKAKSRREVAQALDGIAVELARLIATQRVLCAAMKKGMDHGADNLRAGALLARASKQSEHLIDTGVRPIWNGLPADAFTDKTRAKELELARADQRVGAVLAARARLKDECADRYHAAAEGKLVGRAWETVETGIEREYEALVEQTLGRIVKAGKDRRAGEKSAKAALEHVFSSGRRSFADKRLARALDATQGTDKPTGKGAVVQKRADKVGNK